MIKLGQRVQLLYCPDHRGTVTRLYHNGGFRVSYDSHDRPKDYPRSRVDYPASKAALFVKEGAIEIIESESKMESKVSSVLDELIKRYGLSS